MPSKRLPALTVGRRERFRNTLELLLSLTSRLRSCRDVLGETVGLNPPQFAVLFGVASHDDGAGITIKALADKIQMASTHVTTLAGQLVDMEFLTKQPNKDDGRSVLIKLTVRGQRAIAEVMPLIRHAEDTLFQGLPPKELAIFDKLLHGLLDASERALDGIQLKSKASQRMSR